MRTTLDIADDVIQAAEELGRLEKKSAGEVITELARRALAGQAAAQVSDYARAVEALPSLPRRDGPTVTMKIVNELRDRQD